MANVNSNSFTLFFAVVACLVSGTLLSSASLGLKDTQQENVKVDKQKSVLQAAGLYTPGDSNEAIAGWFVGDNPSIRPFLIKNETGEVLTEPTVEDYLKKPKDFSGISIIYECNKEGSESYILPVVGKGLWGKMFGYLALAKNGDDVLGIRFYDHKETPGLGAEVTEPWFEEQFKPDQNKKLLKEGPGSWMDRFVGLDVLKGLKVENLPEADRSYAVDGISGATITANGVKAILKEQLKTLYGPFLNQTKS